MFVSVCARASALLLVSCLVGSCASLGPVRGIAPSLQATDVEASSGDVTRILHALALDTGIRTERPDMWYLVAQAGFNYVDDRCSEYFYTLFRLNRRREAVKSGLTAFGQTTNAILQATGATTVSMTVVAQAFGLASSMTDIVAGTYLYQLPPATTREFVAKMQRAFREGAAHDQLAIDTPTASYHVIQDYLSLCLPPTIEARLVEHVADANAVADPSAGANIGVRVGSAQVLQPLTSVRERLPAAPALRPRACLPTEYEATLRDKDIAEILNALCGSKNGGLSDVRKLAHQFFKGYGQGSESDRPDILSCGLKYRDSAALHEAIDRANGQSCAQLGLSSAEAVGLSLR